MLGVVRVNPNIWWYFARAGGLVAWGLLATSVFWGLLYAGRLTRKRPPPAWNFDIHRFLGGLSVIFVAIHVTALMADRYVDFGVSQVFMPFASRWRPGAVAWGITAFYLLVAVEVTSSAMRWLPRRLWRKIHLLSFALFAFSTVHAIQTGTDTANPVVRVLGVILLATATVTAGLRIAQGRRRAAAGPRPAKAAPATPWVGAADRSVVPHIVVAAPPSEVVDLRVVVDEPVLATGWRLPPADRPPRVTPDRPAADSRPPWRPPADRPPRVTPARPAADTPPERRQPPPPNRPFGVRRPKVPRFAEPPESPRALVAASPDTADHR